MGVALSIVVPCYNEALRLPERFEEIQRYLATTCRSSEIVLVDDGSTDGTQAYLREVERRHTDVLVVALPRNRGKGRAVAEGVLRTSGDLVLVTDADLSTPIAEVTQLESAVTAGADVAFGSRAAPGAREVNQPVHRQLMGKTFNRLVQALLLPGFQDTQCGFKLFRGIVARELFADLGTEGFAFDVEVLWRAKLAGYRIEEVPVRWLNSEGSRVLPIRHSLQMGRDVLLFWLSASALKRQARAQAGKLCDLP